MRNSDKIAKKSDSENKRTVYFPSYIMQELGIDRESVTARTVDICVRYLWIYKTHRDQVLEGFSAEEMRFLSSIPQKQGWVRPESTLNNLVRVVELEITEEQRQSMPDLLNKLRELSSVDTVVLCEEIEQSSLYAGG